MKEICKDMSRQRWEPWKTLCHVTDERMDSEWDPGCKKKIKDKITFLRFWNEGIKAYGIGWKQNGKKDFLKPQAGTLVAASPGV